MTDDLTTKWLNPKPKGKWKNVQSEDETIIKLDSVSNFEINNEEKIADDDSESKNEESTI